MSERALVTGGAGFIGSHLCDSLVADGHQALAFDDLSTGRHENVERAIAAGAHLEVGDIADPKAIGAAMASFGPTVVFHLAAHADVRRAVADPGHDARVNVVGTVCVLEAARAVGAPVVFSGTGGALYGEGAGRDLPFGEDAEIAPESAYGQAKLAAEGYLDLYRRTRGQESVTVRFSNVYGPRQEGTEGAGVVGIFCNDLIAGRRPTVFGGGEQTRDFVYVADVVGALRAAAQRLLSGADLPPAMNIGSGQETSVLELASRIGALEPDYDFSPQPAPARPGEIARVSLDASLAAEYLEWRPRVPLDEGLRLTYESISAHARG